VKVVFLEDVAGTAKIGDIKDVKPGFARNYLLPRRLALPATGAIVKSAEARAVREERLQDARDRDARSVADQLDGQAISFSARAGTSGKLFGSVGTADIAERVGGILKSEFDRHNVALQEPIKELGDYAVVVRLTRNVSATVNVSVVGEDGTTAADIKARAEGGTGKAAAPRDEETDEAASAGAGSDEYASDEADEKADDE